MERLIFGILRYVASYDDLNTLDVSSFQAMFFIVRIAILLWQVTYFRKEYFSFISSLNTQSQLHRGTTCTKSFLSPNGNCSPTSSISLSWSSAIQRFFPRRRPRDNDCYRDYFCLSFSECFQIILWRV